MRSLVGNHSLGVVSKGVNRRVEDCECVSV